MKVPQPISFARLIVAKLEYVGRGVPIGGVWGGVTPPFISFVGKICCCRQIQGKGENEKGEQRKKGKEKEKRKGKERKENERKKKGKRETGKERKEKEKREKEKKKLEKKERKRKEKMREDRKGVCHWQVKIVLLANVGLYASASFLRHSTVSSSKNCQPQDKLANCCVCTNKSPVKDLKKKLNRYT